MVQKLNKKPKTKYKQEDTDSQFLLKLSEKYPPDWSMYYGTVVYSRGENRLYNIQEIENNDYEILLENGLLAYLDKNNMNKLIDVMEEISKVDIETYIADKKTGEEISQLNLN